MQTDPTIYSQNCSNCGTGLVGKYCFNCGQKKIGISDRSVKAFAMHFIEESLTFDSKFFRSVKYLFLKPGNLTLEFISGRFVSFVSPLKMYLFTSLVTLFILIKLDPDQYTGLMEPQESDNIFQMTITPIRESKGMNEIEFKESFNEKVNDMTALSIIFIMVAFSIILKLAYIYKHIYYVEHLVFTLHFFSMVLILFTLGTLFENISPTINYLFLFLIPCVYLFFAVKRVYHTKWYMAIVPSVFLSFAYWMLLFLWTFTTIIIGALRA